jgi:hypothetical protein
MTTDWGERNPSATRRGSPRCRPARQRMSGPRMRSFNSAGRSSKTCAAVVVSVGRGGNDRSTLHRGDCSGTHPLPTGGCRCSAGPRRQGRGYAVSDPCPGDHRGYPRAARARPQHPASRGAEMTPDHAFDNHRSGPTVSVDVTVMPWETTKSAGRTTKASRRRIGAENAKRICSES